LKPVGHVGIVKVSGCTAQPTDTAGVVVVLENINEQGGPMTVEIVWLPLYPKTLEPIIVTLEPFVKLAGQAIPNPVGPVKVAVVPLPVMLPIGTVAPVPATMEVGEDGDTVNEVAPGWNRILRMVAPVQLLELPQPLE
jgi:hypothetical protein